MELNQAIQVTPAQLITLLSATIPAKLNVMITGAPGVGKTDIVKMAADVAGVELLVSHPVTDDPTDYKGLPFPAKDGLSASFLPFGQFEYALKSTSRLVWLWDDFGQAANAVQSAAMQLFHGGQLNGHRLPEHVSFILCTNRRGDRAGVGGVLEPVKSRFQTIVDLVPDVDSWSQWAFGAGIPATMIAFLRFRPELLSKFTPTADMSNSPMPRTWANLAKLEALNLPQAIESAAMAGAVGEGAAMEYIAFRRMFQNLTSIDAILLDPAKCKLPTAPNELYATCTALASKATDANLSRIGTVANRLNDAGRGEFAVLLMRDCIRRTPKLQYTDAFIRISSGPLGQLISGMEN
jgi:hypothetical protein